MKYVRTKNGRIYSFIDIKIVGDTVIGYVNENDKNTLDGGVYLDKEQIIKQANTIRGLIMKGDLIFAKDGYSGINAKALPSIACDDIDKCNQFFEKYITKFYIELSNGDYHLVAKEERGELALL